MIILLTELAVYLLERKLFFSGGLLRSVLAFVPAILPPLLSHGVHQRSGKLPRNVFPTNTQPRTLKIGQLWFMFGSPSNISCMTSQLKGPEAVQ